MKKNKVLWITVSVGCILICIICVTAFLLISNENKSSKYYEQMRSARQYVTDGDYESIIAAYKAAIDLKPEDPQAYMELSELYMELGEYEQAYEVAQLGYSNTQDRRFRTLINDIELVRYDDRENSSDDEKKIAEQKSQDVTLRYVNIETVTDYCYQEYVDEYGDATMTYVSADEGYRAKFAGFNGYAYFKNTSKYPTLIDTSTRIPEKIQDHIKW